MYPTFWWGYGLIWVSSQHFQLVLIWPRIPEAEILKKLSVFHVFTIFREEFHPPFMWGCTWHNIWVVNTFSVQVGIPEFFIWEVVTNDKIQSKTKGSLRDGTAMSSVQLPRGPLLVCQDHSKSDLVWPGMLANGFKLLNKWTSVNTSDSEPSIFKDVLAIFQALFQLRDCDHDLWQHSSQDNGNTEHPIISAHSAGSKRKKEH